MKFTTQNVSNELKIEKRKIIGMSVIFTTLLLMFSLIYCYFFIENITFIALIVLSVLALGVVVYLIFSRKIRADIKSGNIVYRNVRAKQVHLEDVDYEAGSGMLYTPVLADILPKMYKQKMKPVCLSYIITDENEKYEIANDVNPENKEYTLCFGEKSNIYLGYMQ